MSSRVQIYLGPYVACVRTKVNFSVTVNACPNKLFCKMFSNTTAAAFCFNCGCKTEPVLREMSGPAVGLSDLLEGPKIKERLTSANHDDQLSQTHEILIPNVRWTFDDGREPVDVAVNGESTGQHAVFEHTTSRERDGFRKAFAAELAAVVEAYGVANVEVLWGLLIYYH